MKTRVAIVEDDPKYRAGLVTLLGSQPSFRVAEAFPAAQPFLERAERAGATPPWDLVIMDLGLPGLSGADAIRRLKKLHQATPVVVFTVFEDSAAILEAICAGADGYLLKRTPADELVQQLRAVAEGGSPLTPGVAKTVLEVVRRNDAGGGPAEEDARLVLSPRERDVLRLLADGLVNKQVADQLGISFETVRTYVRRIYEKLQVKTVGQAVHRAVRDGMI